MTKSVKPENTIQSHLEAAGVSRRDFLRLCSVIVATAPAGMALTKAGSVAEIAAKIGKARRPSVIWLHFQDCTGCTETLLRTSAPDAASLILDIISLDYHETLMAASGKQAEAALQKAMTDNAGKYVLVVEGAIPTRDDGVYMQLGGRPAVQVVKEAASKAAAVIAIGSCASWGGVPSADPNPTGAVGVDTVISGKPIVNLPGCPPNPYNLLAVVLEYVTMNRLPELDDLRRPIFAYERVIHENCPRRAHFDAGRFANRLWRRRPSQGMVPLQAWLQRSSDSCGLLDPALQRNPWHVADWTRYSLPGMHGEERGLEDPNGRDGAYPHGHATRYVPANLQRHRGDQDWSCRACGRDCGSGRERVVGGIPAFPEQQRGGHGANCSRSSARRKGSFRLQERGLTWRSPGEN